MGLSYATQTSKTDETQPQARVVYFGASTGVSGTSPWGRTRKQSENQHFCPKKPQEQIFSQKCNLGLKSYRSVSILGLMSHKINFLMNFILKGTKIKVFWDISDFRVRKNYLTVEQDCCPKKYEMFETVPILRKFETIS